MPKIMDYHFGLNFMGRILQDPPDASTLENMACLPDNLSHWPGVAPVEADKLRTALAGNLKSLARAVAEDHLRLFSGPEPLAPPWESVWLERDKLLFGTRTEEVARIYLDWGIRIANAVHEPEDHLGYELCFLAYLGDIAQNRPQQLSQSGKTANETLWHFLHRHILAFAPAVLKSAMNNAASDFYGQACKNCLTMLREFEKVV